MKKLFFILSLFLCLFIGGINVFAADDYGKDEFVIKMNGKSIDVSKIGTSIDCENDATFTSVTTCTYSDEGPHVIRAKGVKSANSMFKGNKQLISIEHWGNKKWSDMGYMFNEAENFEGISDSAGKPDLSTVWSIYHMFNGAIKFNGNIGAWNVSNVTNMAGTFWNAKKFNKSLNNWNVANVVTMSHMFDGAEEFNGDISNWKIRNVGSMWAMFNGAESFNQDISKWSFTGATNMENFLHGAKSFSIENYDKLLNKLGDSKDTLKLGLFDHAMNNSSLKYCNGKKSREDLKTGKKWNISGDTLDCKPKITIKSPTTLSGTSITDTTIYITDLGGVKADKIEIDTSSTAKATNLDCKQIDDKIVDCTISVDKSGDLVIKMINTNGQVKTARKNNYIIDKIKRNKPIVSVDTSFGINKPNIKFSALDDIGIERYEITYLPDNAGTGTGSIKTDTFNGSTGSLDLILDNDELNTPPKIHEIKVVAFDKAGNKSETIVRFPPIIKFKTPTLISNKDITDATVTVESPNADGALTGITLNDFGTNATLGDCTGSDKGTSEPYKSPVTCKINNITSSGNIEITAIDFTTKAKGQNSQSFIIDKVLPTIDIVAPKKEDNKAITNTKIFVMDANGFIEADKVTISTVNTSAIGEDKFSVSNLKCKQTNNQRVDCTLQIDGNTGKGDLKVEVTDKAGNKATKTETGYIIDTIKPEIKIITGTMLSGGTITDTRIEITDNYWIETGSISSVGTVNVDLDCEKDISNIKIKGTNKIQTSGNLKIEVIDKLGNKATKTEIGYVIDKEAPVLTINTGITISMKNEKKYLLRGTCGKLEKTNTYGADKKEVSIILSGTSKKLELNKVKCSTEGKYSTRIDLSKFLDGEIDIEVIQEDKVGNKGNKKGKLKKDTKAPVINAINMQSVLVNNPITAIELTGTTDNAPLKWEVKGLPKGITYSETTHTISGIMEEQGNRTVTIKLIDNIGNYKELTFTISGYPRSSGGGSGGGAARRDRCSGGDNSPSYYDGKCGEKSEEDEKKILQTILRMTKM